jgi:hypothetical protein
VSRAGSTRRAERPAIMWGIVYEKSVLFIA